MSVNNERKLETIFLSNEFRKISANVFEDLSHYS